MAAKAKPTKPATPESADTAPSTDAKGKGKKGEETMTVDLLMANLSTRFGKGAVFMSISKASLMTVDTVSTHSFHLDKAIGIGGLPRGRIVEIYGPESSGKTTLCLSIVAEAQKLGLTCAYIDAEHAMDIGYAKALGVDVGKLLFNQPDSGEQALDIVDEICGSGVVGVVVIDSVAALAPQDELNGEMTKAFVGVQARMMSKVMRKICTKAAKSNTLVIFINQLRMKIGVMFGSPETTPGGNALKYAASVRLDIRRIGQAKDGETVIGNETRVKVVKNKLAPPFQEAIFNIVYGKGIDQCGEVYDLALEHGVIEKNGNTYSYKGDKLGVGRQNTIAAMGADQAVYAKIKADVLAKTGAPVVAIAPTTEADRARLAAQIEANMAAVVADPEDEIPEGEGAADA